MVKSVIVNGEKKYIVVSEKGKRLSRPYGTREEADKRLRQIEYFKHRKSSRG